MAGVWREGRNVSMQKHVYNMQRFKISEPQAQSPPSYLYHAHEARQTADTCSESGFHVQTSTGTPCRCMGKRKTSTAVKQTAASGVPGAQSAPIPQGQSQGNAHAEGREGL